MTLRWPQEGPKLSQDELRWVNIGMRWLKMDKIRDKMRQDSAKMRKMRDVSSVGAPWRGYEGVQPANNPANLAQAGFKVAPEGAKVAPRWPKIAPRCAKMAPRWPPGGPRRARGGTKMAQEGSNMAPRGPKRPPRCSKRAQDEARMAQHRARLALTRRISMRLHKSSGVKLTPC